MALMNDNMGDLMAMGPALVAGMDGDEVFLDHKPETFEMLLDALRVARTNLAEALGIVVQGQQKFGIVFEELLKYRGLKWT